MNELTIVLQFIAFLFIFYVLLLGVKFCSSLNKRKRIRDFAISIDKFSTNDSIVFKIVFKFSDLLESFVIFNNIGRVYDEYIDKDSRLKKGINYISIKILIGLLLSIMYIVLMLLNKQVIDIIVLMVVFILGYVIPDFYCMYISKKNKRITNGEILNAIIIMSNSYKVGRSTEQAIGDVVKRSDGKLKEEFSKVLSDIKIGMSSYEAFRRMYERTWNKTIKEVGNLLYSISKSGVSSSLVFDEMEKKLVRKDKFEEKVRRIYETNLMAFIIFTFLPLIFLIYVMFFKLDLQKIIASTVGGIIIVILFILYLLYSFLIWKITKEVKR